ncbi:MAG: prepilin-type N-terminal cleavage/methylation domain-containing protein [Gallionella sp.]
MHKQRPEMTGFTLVELVMTMVIIGILAAIAAPRFFDKNVFQSRGFTDQVLASLRYAQKAAIAQRRNVCVAFTLPAPSTVTLTIDSNTPPDGVCNPAPAGNLQSPVGGPYVITAPAGIAFAALPAPVDFSFDALGRPTNAPQTIAINGATGSVFIEAETGYVHQ